MSQELILVNRAALKEVLGALRRSPGCRSVEQLQDIDRPYIHNNPITTLYNDYQAALTRDLEAASIRNQKNDAEK